MKRKLDFVTNSSSSSFVGWGISVYDSDLRENEIMMKAAYDKYVNNKYETNKNMTYEQFKEDEEMVQEYIREAGSTLSKIVDFQHGPYDCDYGWIAAPVTKLKDDQTLGDFKREIIKDINEKFGIKINKVDYIEEAWFDG